MKVDVSKINLYFLKEDLNKVLYLLQKEEIIMIKNFNINDNIYKNEELLLIDKSIKILDNYVDKKNKFIDISLNDFEKINNLSDIKDNIIKLNNKLNENIERIKNLNLRLNSLLPFKFISISYLEMMGSYIKFKCFKININNKENLMNFEKYLNDNKIIYEKDNNLYVIALINEIKNDFILNFNLEEIELPYSTLKYKDDISLNKKYIKETIKEKEDIINKLKEYTSYYDNLKIYYDQKLNEIIKNNVPYKQTDNFYYLEGFIKKKNINKLNTLLKNNIKTFEIEEIKDKDILPTAIENKKLIKPFENITNMFSPPSNNDIDPTPPMSIWYWLIFGMMIGDVGYGLVMIVVFYLMLKIKKPKGGKKDLLSVFFYSGFSSVIFGILMGGFFGKSVNFLGLINKNWNSSVLEPLNDPLKVLIFSLIVGIFHIITGLILKIIVSFKNKDYLEGITKGLSWILILCGILFVVVKINIVGYILVLLGVIIILFLSGGKSKNILKRTIKGLGGLYGITNYLSDILSYSRILALALSGSVIGYTMNLLAGLVSGSFIGYIFAILILLFGHLFNFGMSLLSAYVHDGRLQYLEFFNKFYEGGGYLFQPFGYNLKYIYEIKEN